ncbi:MAG: hypothetical protein NC218_11550 [Acetobacter sp.]|nr:hypothetical protein [Acetobacter sp.]
MQQLLNKALEIAETYDVSTIPNQAVVYSVSYMPTNENKEKALDYVHSVAEAKMLDDTPCGKALTALGLDGKVNEVGAEVTRVWRIASTRYIAAAAGNINAFVDAADERSTFCTTELAEILQNEHITHINGIDKFVFAKKFQPQRY